MSSGPTPSLSGSFRHLAGWTAARLGASTRLGVSFNEETITESLLLKLAEQHRPPHFLIKAFSKIEEGTGTQKTGGMPTGADWDFFFADWTGAGVAVRVQAKRLFPSGKYESLDGSDKQLQDLRRNCGTALPIYVFYNDTSRNWPWSSWLGDPSCAPRFRGASVWGCSFAPVTGIPKVKQPKPVQIAALQPWHCLVCPWSSRGATSASLPRRVVSAIRSAYNSVPVTDDDRFSAASGLLFETTTTWPAWARALKGERAVPGRMSFSIGSGYTPDQYLSKTGLKGVALIEQLLPDGEE